MNDRDKLNINYKNDDYTKCRRLLERIDSNSELKHFYNRNDVGMDKFFVTSCLDQVAQGQPLSAQDMQELNALWKKYK